MARIDFKEISQANLATGEQDSFEFFARDFLEILGYEIISPPSRGRDGGKDMIVSETRRGIGGITIYHWLVSCKHYAHSGKSVNSTKAEIKIETRVRRHNCDGFIGFYSTLAETGLIEDLEGIKRGQSIGKLPFEFQIFDKEKIETNLLAFPEFQLLLKKYFPISYQSQTLSNFGINIAMSRFGMPRPILFKHPNENKELSVEEVIRLFPQGNQYGFIPWTGEMFFLITF
ncbi:MAG TPA: restriction endonuclease [Pyrinomonadaceae bacterium]|jgi:hypothetical protein